MTSFLYKDCTNYYSELVPTSSDPAICVFYLNFSIFPLVFLGVERFSKFVITSGMICVTKLLKGAIFEKAAIKI